jgi:hypothetical protein
MFCFRRSNEKPYHDLDAFDYNEAPKPREVLSSRPTTSYRDLTDDLSLSPSPSSSPLPSSNQIPLSDLSLHESKISDENFDEQEQNPTPKETFFNQNIPYPVVNDKRDLDVINRQLKNQLRELEASKNNPLYDQQSNLINYERLKKQNEFINLRIRIEKLKRNKTKTQKEKEQNKKQFHLLLQVKKRKNYLFEIIFVYYRNFVNFNVLCDQPIEKHQIINFHQLKQKIFLHQSPFHHHQKSNNNDHV